MRNVVHLEPFCYFNYTTNLHFSAIKGTVISDLQTVSPSCVIGTDKFPHLDITSAYSSLYQVIIKSIKSRE